MAADTGRVQRTQALTNEKRTTLLLDKIKKFQGLFEYLETVCGTAEDINLHVKAAHTAILRVYMLCEIHKKCRDTFWRLVEEMNDLLNYRLEELVNALKVKSNTQAAFIAIAEAIDEVLIFVEEQSKGVASRFIRNIVSMSYESKIKCLQDKLKRAMGSLSDSMSSRRLEEAELDIGGPRWERVADDDLRLKLKSVLKAHYTRGEGCLEDTRTNLLTKFDTWIRKPSEEKSMWVYGHAGSGKSALFNSIAENLDNAGIPFTFFPCKQDDTELSDILRIFPTIAYSFAELYTDYHKSIPDILNGIAGYSLLTCSVIQQSESLFGKAFDLLSRKGSRRPPVHVILVDGFDECKSHRDESKASQEHRAFLETLLKFADTVPWIKVLVSSRLEPDIANFFKDTSYSVRHIDVNDEKWRTSAAIRLFISDTSEKSELGLSHAQIERLQEKASGLFVWCTTAFRYIKGSKEGSARAIKHILKDQPVDSKNDPYASLYLLYQHVLDSAVPDVLDKELMKLVLGAVFAVSTHQPLSVAAIVDIISPGEEGDKLKEVKEKVERIIKSLSVILYIEDETNTVRSHHITVLDFIGKTSSKYIPAYLFEGCLAILNRDLRFNICDLEDSHLMNKDVPDLPVRIARNISEALQYSCLFWFCHLEQSGLKVEGWRAYAFLNSLKALYWVEVLSLLGIIDRGILILQNCSHFFADQPNIRGTASEWERFLSAFGDALQSTPHVYLSAISWVPRESQLWDIFHDSFSTELPTIYNVPAAWSRERWSESVGTEVNSVAYSADGRLFAAGCDKHVRFWDANSGSRARAPFTSQWNVLSIAFSSDNRWLVSGHIDHNVRLWDLHTDSAVPRVLEGHTGWVHSVAFSSDGQRIVSGSSDTSIRVWDVESGTAIGYPFKEYDGRVISATFSADDTHIVSASWNGTMRIRNSETGEHVGEIQGHLGWIRSAASSPDGRFIVSGSADGTVSLWDAETFKRVEGPFMFHTHDVKSVCFSYDSKLVASASREIRVWNIETCSLVCVLRGHTNDIVTIAFSPDGCNVVSGSLDNTIRVWDINGCTSTDQPSEGHSTMVTCLSYTPNDDVIVSGSRDGHIYLYNTHTGATVGNLMKGHTSKVNSLAVSSDGQWLVSGSSDKTLRIWDFASGTMLGEPILAHTDEVNSVAIAPDNIHIASSSTDRTVRLWDVATRRQMMIFEGHENLITSVTFSADGGYIISGSWDRTVRIWDTRTGMAFGVPLRNHSSLVLDVTVSPDGNWFASASCDGTARIWSISSHLEIHVLRGHFSDVTSVVFSPDSKFLVSGSKDGTIRVWNVQTGEAVGHPVSSHTSSVNSIAISSRSLELVSSSSDRTVRVCDMRARTDLELHGKGKVDYMNSQLDEEELFIHWNVCRARLLENDGWVRDGEKLLLWVPRQHRPDIGNGTKFVISSNMDGMRPEVDYRKLFRYSGTLWKDINGANG